MIANPSQWPGDPLKSNLRERVIQAAEAVLKRNGSVGTLELFQEIGFFSPSHLEGWRKGNRFYQTSGLAATQRKTDVGSTSLPP